MYQLFWCSFSLKHIVYANERYTKWAVNMAQVDQNAFKGMCLKAFSIRIRMINVDLPQNLGPLSVAQYIFGSRADWGSLHTLQAGLLGRYWRICKFGTLYHHDLHTALSRWIITYTYIRLYVIFRGWFLKRFLSKTMMKSSFHWWSLGRAELNSRRGVEVASRDFSRTAVLEDAIWRPSH